jgi:prophage antirepressor-like protein
MPTLWWAVWEHFGAPTLAGNANPIQSATLLIRIFRGSSLICKRAYAMPNLSVFDFHNHSVRTTVINDSLWFIANDIATALGYTNSREAIRKHVDSDDKADVTIRDGSQSRKVNALNESGMYSLVLRSRKPEAKAFKRWVTFEVLPSIRKTGSYKLKEVQDTSHRLNDAQLGHIYHTAMAYSKATNQHYSTQFARLKRAFGVASYKHIRSIDYADACKLLGVEPKQLGAPAPKVAFDQNAAQLLTDQSEPAMAPYLRRIMCDGNGKPIMHIPNNYFVMPAESFANALESESAFINTSTLEAIAKVCMDKLVGRAKFNERRRLLEA